MGKEEVEAGKYLKCQNQTWCSKGKPQDELKLGAEGLDMIILAF